jgi:hypothetical protein
MKKLLKIFAVSAVILSLTALGVSNARASGWPIAAGVASGVAAGAIVGTAVAAAAAQPVYYGYPAPVYTYGAPAYPAPAYAALGYYYPRVYPYYYPWFRGGPYWGRSYHGYRPHRRW